jgi:hypothetical protein
MLSLRDAESVDDVVTVARELSHLYRANAEAWLRFLSRKTHEERRKVLSSCRADRRLNPLLLLRMRENLQRLKDLGPICCFD